MLKSQSVLAAPIEEIVVSDLDNSSAKTLRSDKKKKQKLSKSQTMQGTTKLLYYSMIIVKYSIIILIKILLLVSELDSSYTKTPKSDKKKRRELTDSQTNIQGISLLHLSLFIKFCNNIVSA